jgi:glycosyltransferase involved in cell wall biosynthesis
MKATVIISTYNSPVWLEKVLWGYECQSDKNFELIVADDGSDEPTKQLIDRFRKGSPMEIIHVWHPDDGFQKSVILNKAILASTTEYLIFSDGDCIPRADFVKTHKKYAEKGYFLSGGYFMLPMETSHAITQDHIKDGTAFNVRWLYANGLKKTYKTLKLTSWGLKGRLLNFFTPTKATWNGHSASGWRQDIIAINGFNEVMQYGGQDRELGERLVNYGVIGKQIRYSAVCVHLDHKRGYNLPESIAKNKKIREETKQMRKVWTDFGIIKGVSKIS